MTKLSDNAEQIFKSRYALNEDETWDGLCQRVAGAMSKYTVDPAKYFPIFYEIIYEQLFIPGGRILRNAGKDIGSLFNCYHLPIGDSREEIGECLKKSFILWGEGGGIGINFSTLRPDGAPIKKMGGHASGPVSFMRALDGIASTVESGGQRRAASLGLLEVWHPDIYNYIRAKHVDHTVSYFNLSVGVFDDFLEAAHREDEWVLNWHQREWGRVNARELWNSMVEGAYYNGEPGIINMDKLRINNSWYFAPISGTNPCGEACLESNGVCNLGSIVLSRFVSGTTIRRKQIEETVRYAVRFLDACIDANNYSFPEIQQTAQRGRRIGLFAMGLADMFINLGVRYGSDRSLDIAESISKLIRNAAYDESIKMATEKGAFPAYDPVMYPKSKFIRTLPATMRRDIRNNGIRNVTLLAAAPTGTISLLADTTNGIEPLTYRSYRRKDRVSERVYVHPAYRTAIINGDAVPDYLVDTTDLTPTDHLNMQSSIQKYVDGAVSKTINIQDGVDCSDLSDILLESIINLKGVTIYRDGSREGQPIVPMSDEETRNLIEEASTSQDAEAVACASGECEI